MTSLYYHEIEPDPALQAFVTCYWEFIAGDIPAGIYDHVVMPDGCVTIVYGRTLSEGSPLLRLVGPSLEARTVPIRSHDIFWGIRFWPGAAGSLLHLAPRPLYNRVFEAQRHIPEIATALLEHLSACNTGEEAIRVFDEILLKRAPAAEILDEKIVMGVKAIVAAKGEIKISALAEASGLSERQFQRRFQEAVGLTPKQFARIRRFRTSMSNVLEKDPKDWGWIAAERGYADQPHLVREFSQLVGESPTTFAERIRSIEHGPVKP